jgi:hypothetical protein
MSVTRHARYLMASDPGETGGSVVGIMPRLPGGGASANVRGPPS